MLANVHQSALATDLVQPHVAPSTAVFARYIIVNGFSGQKFYTEGGIQLYNIVFTLGPILFLGCFDQDVTLADSEKFPELYVLGINDVFFNTKVCAETSVSCKSGRQGEIRVKSIASAVVLCSQV